MFLCCGRNGGEFEERGANCNGKLGKWSCLFIYLTFLPLHKVPNVHVRVYSSFRMSVNLGTRLDGQGAILKLYK